MTREQYQKMTSATRRAVSRLPGGAAVLRLPTYASAGGYLLTLIVLLVQQDMRILRVIAVPACCFFCATALRALINRERPYDRFRIMPVGAFVRGKRKSLPSRHAASAAAIAFAAAYAFPSIPVAAAMTLLALLVALLRVVGGQHYPSDVAAALLLSAALSALGYLII